MPGHLQQRKRVPLKWKTIDWLLIINLTYLYQTNSHSENFALGTIHTLNYRSPYLFKSREFLLYVIYTSRYNSGRNVGKYMYYLLVYLLELSVTLVCTNSSSRWFNNNWQNERRRWQICILSLLVLSVYKTNKSNQLSWISIKS